MSEITYAFLGGLTKSRDDKGFLHIKGVASDDTLDLDGQIADPVWVADAMKSWFKTGNIREMHGASAVGKATTLTQSGTQVWIEGKIVDPLAAVKVEEDVYGGLSIGIKGARIDRSDDALKRAPNGIIVGGRIVEVSLVDLPANPSAVLELVKTVNGETTSEVLGEIDELEKADAYKPTPYKRDADETVQCPKCDRFNDTDAHFCDQCGFKLDGATDVEVKAAEPDVEKTVSTPIKDFHDAIVTKAGDTHDPAQLAEIRTLLSQTIAAELSELESGADNEMSDLYQLLNALGTFLSWWEDEADEGETDQPFPDDTGDDDNMAYIGLGVSADLVKRVNAPEATDDDKNEFRSEMRKALGLDAEIATKTEVEELREANKSLKADLDSIRELAAPGQPALRATQQQQVKSAEADELETKAARFRATAYTQTDAATLNAYLESAATLEKRAKELRASAPNF